MSRNYVLSQSAFLDIAQIWNYLADEHNPEIADQAEERIFRAFDSLVRFPHLGHSRTDLTKQSVLFFPVQSYLIVYKPEPEQVVILAVLHSARDLKRILKSRPS